MQTGVRSDLFLRQDFFDEFKNGRQVLVSRLGKIEIFFSILEAVERITSVLLISIRRELCASGRPNFCSAV